MCVCVCVYILEVPSAIMFLSIVIRFYKWTGIVLSTWTGISLVCTAALLHEVLGCFPHFTHTLKELRKIKSLAKIIRLRSSGTGI